jgi:hypothetical protein
MPSIKLNIPHPNTKEPKNVLPDSGTSFCLTAFQSIPIEIAVTTYVKAWNRPSQTILVLAFTNVSGGSFAESILCI